MKKKRNTIWMIIIVFIAIVAIVPFAVNAYVVQSVKPEILAPEEANEYGADCILVLGALVYEDGRLSQMLEDRVKVGIELYKQGSSPKILMSGDHGTDEYDEVNAMKKYANGDGIAEEDLFMDHAGFSTYVSVYRAREIFGVKKVIIVTQEFHLSRALYIAKCLGLDAVGVSSDLQPYATQTNSEVREFFARNKDFLSCIFKPKPTYLEQTIPINGDGRITQD